MTEADSETELDVVASTVGAEVDSVVAPSDVVVVTGSGAPVDSVAGSGVAEVVGATDEVVTDGVPETGVVERPHLVPAVVKVAP